MLRTTIIGGFLFLLPLGILIFVVGKAYKFSRALVEPIREYLPFDAIAGVAAADIVAIMGILLASFLGGLALRFPPVARLGQRIENRMEALLPQYTAAKLTLRGVGGLSGDRAPVTITIGLDDCEYIAFEMERSGERVVAYVPGAPNAWSGSVVIVAPDRTRPIDLPPHKVAGLMRTFGRGTLAALGKGDLPAG